MLVKICWPHSKTACSALNDGSYNIFSMCIQQLGEVQNAPLRPWNEQCLAKGVALNICVKWVCPIYTHFLISPVKARRCRGRNWNWYSSTNFNLFQNKLGQICVCFWGKKICMLHDTDNCLWFNSGHLYGFICAKLSRPMDLIIPKFQTLWVRDAHYLFIYVTTSNENLNSIRSRLFVRCT